MSKSVVSFKKACEEKSADADQNNISIKATLENLPSALHAAKELFGYLSLTEHYHASHTRFGQDIFEGTNKLILGGLMYEGSDLVLEKIDSTTQQDYNDMGVRDIWITNKPPSNERGCEVHSLVWNGKEPYVVIREEMKHALPKTHSLMMDCIQKLQSRRPIWESAVRETGLGTVLRPSP